MNVLKRVFLFGSAGLLPITAYAYIGPGAGLSLLGALWALVLALLTAIVFIVAWPIKRMLRKRRKARELEAANEEPAEADNVTPLPNRKHREIAEGKRTHHN